MACRKRDELVGCGDAVWWGLYAVVLCNVVVMCLCDALVVVMLCGGFCVCGAVFLCSVLLWFSVQVCCRLKISVVWCCVCL